MKKLLIAALLVGATASLGGCYVEPGYSYVRGNDGGGAYYGRATTVYDSGYYAPYDYYSPYYSPYGYYGYPGGVSVGVGAVWYGGSHYRRGYRGGYRHDYRHDYRGHPGHWQGDRHDGGHHWRGSGGSYHGHGDHGGSRHSDGHHH